MTTAKARRVSGESITAPIRPKTRLLSATANPAGTLFSVWHGSRHNQSVSPAVAQEIYNHWDQLSGPRYAEAQSWTEDYIEQCYPEHGTAPEIIGAVARMALEANVPAGEAVHFTFQIDNCSVGLREQMVRSKLSSFWSQTSRTADLRGMDITMPDTVVEAGPEAQQVFMETAGSIRSAYRRLEELGVPSEDIRLAPEARVHRLTWMISARSLQLVLNKRVDWMAQATLWEPVVTDVIAELRELEPMLADFYGKPPGVRIDRGAVVYHAYDNENEDRYYGRDPQPVDPLWLAYRGLQPPEHTDRELLDNMKRLYRKLWSDDVLAVVGWDRDDHSVQGPYDLPPLPQKEREL